MTKTDRTDAKVLAQLDPVLHLPVTEPITEAKIRLADFLRRSRQLVEIRKAEKTHHHKPSSNNSVAAEIIIDILTQQISELDRAISRPIEDDQVLSSEARFLRAVPGIAPTVLATLIGMPELGTQDRRHIATLASLGRHARESGTWRGGRLIWVGNRKVREARHIAALTASRPVSALTAICGRMRTKSKPRRINLIAIARQPLVVINAMLRKTPHPQHDPTTHLHLGYINYTVREDAKSQTFLGDQYLCFVKRHVDGLTGDTDTHTNRRVNRLHLFLRPTL